MICCLCKTCAAEQYVAEDNLLMWVCALCLYTLAAEEEQS